MAIVLLLDGVTFFLGGFVLSKSLFCLFLFFALLPSLTLNPSSYGFTKAIKDPDPRLEPIGTEFNLIILGGTSDLALRKIYPALARLHKNKLLPHHFSIIGTSHLPHSQSGFKELLTSFDTQSKEMIDSFLGHVKFCPIDAFRPSDFRHLEKMIREAPHEKTIFYFAVSSELYIPLLENLASRRLLNQNTRAVFEKPFGKDLKTSKIIEQKVNELLDENQVFLMDHYLGKKVVKNLLALRFANRVFEPIWSNEHIEKMAITVSETLGVENRAHYYEQSGSLRDMIQSHVLQLLTYITMDPPEDSSYQSLKHEKLKVLKALKPINKNNIKHSIVFGQYDQGLINGKKVPAYRQEPGVNPSSLTETFIAVKTKLAMKKWEGVDFLLQSGKRLSSRQAEIKISFKKSTHAYLFNENLPANELSIVIQPGGSLSLNFYDQDAKLNTLKSTLSQEDSYIPSDYDLLMWDILAGRKNKFADLEVVQEAWKWIDGITELKDKLGIIPSLYSAGSRGPRGAQDLWNDTSNF